MGSTEMSNQIDSPQFLRMLGDLSAQFINMSLERVDGEIVIAQKRICEVMGIDRCTLWQFSKVHDDFVVTHSWSEPAVKIRPFILLRDKFPWGSQKLLRGEIVRFPDIEVLPPEASKDKDSFRAFDVKANLTFPLSAGSAIFGVLAFGVFHHIRDWSDEEVGHLQLVAQVFANALDRKKKEQELRESETRLSLAAFSAGIGFWVLEGETGSMWGTEKTRELLGFPPGDRVNIDMLFNAIHPEDRKRIREIVERSLQTGENIDIEYRIVHPDGRTHWIAFRGRRPSASLEEQTQLMGVSFDVSERKKAEEELRNSLEEIERLKDLLYAEADFLKGELRQFHGHTEILGESDAIGNVIRRIQQVSETNATVLITGETGTGKELVARAIHGLSKRKDRAMVKVDCASLPSGLIESELFGRERGAYTGALTRQIGRFQLAHQSTIFLDEIGELPLDVQSKLLRVLDAGEFEPLGSPKTVKVNVRIIAATNRDLDKATREGRFREDLYFRLKVFPIVVPPLRERSEDIPLLVWNFVRKFSAEMGKNIRNVRKQTMLALQHHSWPGNVRELRNFIEHALIAATGDTLSLELPSTGLPDAGSGRMTLAHAEHHHIRSVLELTGWRIKGSGGAAELLGIKPSTLYAKMKKLEIPLRHEKDQMVT
jgi:formate hydrogenlyase transcriptional activator